METDSARALQRKNQSLLISLIGVVVGMVFLSYASVPLYKMFCQITGFGGTIRERAVTTLPDKILAREVTVTFNTDVSPELPWEFKSLSKKISLRLGERKLIFFEAKNLSNEPVTGVSTYNVTPDKLGPYIDKIKCFCFEKQTLKPGETMKFPVSFFIDPEMANHRDLDDISTMTLSYTFFRATQP